jgi:hypothetical protein
MMMVKAREQELEMLQSEGARVNGDRSFPTGQPTRDKSKLTHSTRKLPQILISVSISIRISTRITPPLHSLKV